MSLSRRSVLAAGSAFAATTLVSRTASAAPAWEARSGLDAAGYQAKFDQMTAAGFRPVVVDGYNGANGQTQFAAIWRKTGGPDWVARHGLDGAAYQQAFNQFTAQGYRPRWISPYQDGGVKYAAIFSKGGPGDWIARHGLKLNDFQAQFDQQHANGYRLTNVGVSSDFLGGPTYAGIWEKSHGVAWEARSAMNSSDYQAKFNQMASQGFRLKQVCGYTLAGQPFFTAIWDKSGGPAWEAHHNLTTAQFQQKFNQMNAQGYWLTDVSGYSAGGQTMFAGIWEQT